MLWRRSGKGEIQLFVGQQRKERFHLVWHLNTAFLPMTWMMKQSAIVTKLKENIHKLLIRGKLCELENKQQKYNQIK
jgi:hypothetical protein